jgi:uncharacterized protein
MDGLRQAARDFLDGKAIAVAGVSREGGQVGNIVYNRLRGAGYTVFALNPEAEQVEGDPAYPSLSAVPAPVDGVFIATHPAVTRSVVEDCARAGVRRVWIHRSVGQGSVSDDAVALARSEGIAVLDGACPMMFLEPVDLAHRCMRWFLGVTGKLPSGSCYLENAPGRAEAPPAERHG